MKEFLTHLFTDGSQTYFDYTKVMGFISLIIFCILSFISHSTFDPQTWALGASIIIAAAGGVSKIIDKSGTKDVA